MTSPLDRIRPDVRAMHAYPVADATGYLKMDAMENPFGLPPALQKALGERLGALPLNRYPGARQNDLKAALAAYAGAPEGSAIVLGNGSKDHVETVRLLLAHGADPTIRDGNGVLPRELAAARGYDQIVALLEKAS